MAQRAQRVETVDAVVVGSGFGGSVAAYRLAEAGLSTVLLERGRSYAPGQFPRTPADLGRAFWDPAERLYGMFDVWRFKGFDSVVSSGLGGGSLIYANVLLRKDEKWFVHEQRLPGGGYEHWPVDRAALDPFYDEVERMIGVAPYPVEHPPHAATPKTHAMQDAAAELGLDWFRPPLAISFGTHTGAVPEPGKPIADGDFPNLHGVTRTSCRLCGECDIGCNDGAKNSLDHTYLSAAAHLGADLRPLHEVEAIRPRDGGGYLVDYVRHDPATGGSDRASIGCARLVLAAGTFGTTRLLLRAKLPGIGSALGTRLCGNGDLLTFLTGVKDSDRSRPLDVSKGPVITSAIRLPDQLDGFGTGRGAYIQEGGYPGFVDWMAQGLDLPGQLSRAMRLLWERFTDLLTGDADTNMSAELSELLSGRPLSAHALPLLGMGRDVPDGVLSLDASGRLTADWSVETSRVYFDRLRDTMRRIGDVLGADYADNPLWLRKRVVSVHPLGGAPLGRHPGEGVCDPFGEVFGHPGLYVADGAALPGPVGANPALTIAALAERMSRQMLHGDLAATGAGTSGGAVRRGSGGGRAAGSTALSFTEEMKGGYVAGVAEPYDGEAGERLAFRLTITADDVDRFLDDPAHLARAEGWVEAAAFGGRRRVEHGSFNLFLTPGDQADRREMRYLLHFTDVHGAPRTLAGWKDIQVGPPTHIWPDTTTLYYRILAGHVAADSAEAGRPGDGSAAPVLGAGTLHIRLADFLEQLTTFRTDGPDDLKALSRFGRFFLGELWDVYGPADPRPAA